MEKEGKKQIVLAWAKSIQGRLSNQYEESQSIIDQSGIIGAIREEVVRNILESFLPSTTQIGTGQIVDSFGQSSDQVDIIIARGNTPSFRFMGGITAFLYETVLATIEVKSMLYRDKLVEALDNSLSVKMLQHLFNITSKGHYVFVDALRWVEQAGGLERVEYAIRHPSLENSLNCPIEVWKVLPFVIYWLHWENGDWADGQRIISGFDVGFDFFAHLLKHTFKEEDLGIVLQHKFEKAEEVKEIFFKSLFVHLKNDEIPPSTFVLAYGGYEKLNNLIDEVRKWHEAQNGTVHWSQMPRVIMNHKMVMYRVFNEYHCHEFEYPVLFLINGIVEALIEDFHFNISTGLSTGLNKYFNPGYLLGSGHPKHSDSYTILSLPLDNGLPSKISYPNAKNQLMQD